MTGLADPATQLLLDFSRPVALMLVAVLHFIPDEEDPWCIVARLRDALAPGSYLVLYPGLVYLPEWRPDSPDDVPEDPRKFWGLVGVARRG